jgi:hypothetical protein
MRHRNALVGAILDRVYSQSVPYTDTAGGCDDTLKPKVFA